MTRSSWDGDGVRSLTIVAITMTLMGGDVPGHPFTPQDHLPDPTCGVIGGGGHTHSRRIRVPWLGLHARYLRVIARRHPRESVFAGNRRTLCFSPGSASK